MAERLGVDHQQLQQFITSSTWDYAAVRANAARWAVTLIDPAARAWPGSTPAPWARPVTARSG
jgi:hypothetical protein